MKIFIAGGTGTIGRAIVTQLLDRGDTLCLLTRSREKALVLWPDTDAIDIVEGDPCYEGPWQKSLAGCDAVINLVGESVDAQRWNAQFRQRMHDSRVDATRFVAEGILACPEPQRPKTLVNASGISYYAFAEIPNFDDDDIDEAGTGGESFLSALCWDWEAETDVCGDAGVRVVVMRTGMVLGNTGALPRLAGPFRWGFGGWLGSGRQWMSWIHEDDAAGGYLHAIDSAVSGPVNLVAPNNQRNREFARILGRVMGRRSWCKVPVFAIRIAVGEFAEYVVKGCKVVPKALLDSGYAFRYPDLEDALSDLL